MVHGQVPSALYTEYHGLVQASPKMMYMYVSLVWYDLSPGPHPPPRAVFPSSSIPEKFLKQLIDCTSKFAQYQVQTCMVIYCSLLTSHDRHMTIT